MSLINVCSAIDRPGNLLLSLRSLLTGLSRYLLVLVVWVCAAVPLLAQVAPAEINSNLLQKSMKAVLGQHGEVEWKTLSLSDIDDETLELRQQKKLPDTLYVGRVETADGMRWIIPDIAPSKSETFSYVLYLDDKKEVVDVDVLTYRESYGYEIDYPFFRKQFHGMSKPNEVRFGRSIQNISGATISARSITYAVHDLLGIVNNIELN